MNKRQILCAVALLTGLSLGTAIADNHGHGGEGWDPQSRATAQGSVFNTRHNFTMLYARDQLAQGMAVSGLNQYSEVCVYCHTPHGANSSQKAAGLPLWNRTVNTSDYQVFDKVRMVNQPITQPGPGSLTCLSCHDGTISTDSIINMPGSGRYNKDGETSFENNISHLDQWAREWGPVPLAGPTGGIPHKRLIRGSVEPESCMACHNPLEGGALGAPAPDFTVFGLEEDLRDDHPIGILFPYLFGESLRGGVDFWVPTARYTNASGNSMDYFDTNGNNRPDTNEVRMYDTGDGPEVECSSCHDPHGIPSDGENARFNPSFLRVNNLSPVTDASGPGVVGIIPSTTDQGAQASALCLTCHDK